ncbi:hypothetical protein BGZ83_001606 [Gryganskiella cystojenkinii]|nr:hypothetical protein BGZ83_001606 [Gryganskiella cystojenkinii]
MTEHSTFREPSNSLSVSNDQGSSVATNSTLNTIKPTPTPTRTRRLIMDSDDDMDDDDEDEDQDADLLSMPTLGSQKMELQIDQSFSAPTLYAPDESTTPPGSPSRSLFTDSFLEPRTPNMPLSATTLKSTTTTPRPPTTTSNIPAPIDEEDDDLFAQSDSLFNDDFMAQFGPGDLDEEQELEQNKRPLFARRIPLLESTLEDEEEEEALFGSSAHHGQQQPQQPQHDDLGLERLSISQSHRTKSGEAFVPTETTKTTHTDTSSTTIVSQALSKFNVYSRSSSFTGGAAGGSGSGSWSKSGSLMTSQDPAASQLQEDLLEMSARQHDAMLEDMIMEDEQMMDDEQELYLMGEYEEQELLHASDVGQKRKTEAPPATTTTTTGVPRRQQPLQSTLPITATSAESSSSSSSRPLTSLEEVDRLLAESYALDDDSLARSVEASKKSRLGTTTSSSNSTSRGKSTLKPRRPLVPEEPKIDYTVPPVTGAFIRAKTTSGKTLYLAKRVRTSHEKDDYMKELMSTPQGRKPLLSQPIHRMMDDLDAEIRLQKHLALRRVESGDFSAVENDATADVSQGLWFDKYRPKRYTDLMGDERVNREVLSWIKEWDQCVFGRKFKKHIPDYKKHGDFKDFRKPDPLGRPDRKVLMLTGPPGLGKTTMAHVIAKQAGYNVIEVNASDDRTGAAVKGKIEAALEIQSILGSDRPNLLIIDEIDGVSSSGGDQSFIKLLVDLASVEASTGEEKSGSAGGGGGKKKKFTKKPLLRPIICICNDQYAPVLRPLRVIAQIYNFRKPSVRAVVTRLQQICEIEQVPSDTRAFGVLYEMTEGDMRSCLNTLQFIKNKSESAIEAATSTSTAGPKNLRGESHGEGLTVDALSKATIGRKDQSKSLFSVWEELFQAPYARKARSSLKVMEEGRDGLVKDDSNTYISRMVTMVQTNGDYDKLMQGCFENYPTMTFHDTAMSKVVDNGDWLAFYDQLNTRVSSNFEYEVGGYMAYALVSFHRFFAGSVRQKIEYPRKDYEAFVAQKANESILQGMALNLPARLQRQFHKNNFATEFLAPFLRILSPHLRPVNKQLIKPEERAVLKRLVDIMIYFQMTFVQEKTEDGQFVYRLEPSIEKLGDFSTIGLKSVLTNRYATRQLIAQEIEMEIVRKAELAKEERMASFFAKNGGGPDPKSGSLDSASASLPAGASKELDQDKLEREAVDFFGRTITSKESTSLSLDGTSLVPESRPKKKTRIWYKFNEGFSNAVKAKVFINELL